MDGSGVGQGAILNQNSTVNSPSTPAEKGSIIVAFATGAGQTDPGGADGQIAGDTLPKPVLPVSVKMGARPRYFTRERHQGMVAGVLQVN